MSRLRSKVAPATEREIAVELAKLAAVFRYTAGDWATAAPLYVEALGVLPADLLREAVSTYIRTAGGDTFFPKPGELRALVDERFQQRKNAYQREVDEVRSEGWPTWRAEIWGPPPYGPQKCIKAFDKKAQRDLEDRQRLLEVGALKAARNYTHAQAWEAWAEGERCPPDQNPFLAQDQERALLRDSADNYPTNPDGSPSKQALAYARLATQQAQHNLQTFLQRSQDAFQDLDPDNPPRRK